jgi:sodium/potassium-transporting ATPase subunit alpha
MSLFRVGLFSNRLVLLGIASELALLWVIAYLPPAHALFGTAPLEPWQLALSLPFAVFMLAADELRRYYLRRGSGFVGRWLAW